MASVLPVWLRLVRSIICGITGTDNDHDPTVGYAYYSPPSPHGISGGGGGAGGAPEPEPGITDVSNIVTSQGIFTKTTTAI